MPELREAGGRDGSGVLWTGQRRAGAWSPICGDSRVQGAAVGSEGMDFYGVQNARKRRAKGSAGEGETTFICLNF